MHPLAKTHIHYDERGLGFLALGIAKAKNDLVAILTTSGSALGNLYPAVMEAKMSRIPLVIITADRPTELHNCGANQTVDQVHFFGNYVSSFVELPTAEESISLNYIRSTLDYTLHQAKRDLLPIHLNIKQREPFLPYLPEKPSPNTPTCFIDSSISIKPSDLVPLIDLVNEHSKGLILAGSGLNEEDAKSIFSLAEHLQWPILADITSMVRSYPHDLIIPHASLLLKQPLKGFEPQMLLHFGERYVSKDLTKWIDSFSSKTHYVQIADHALHIDPSCQVTMRLNASAQQVSTILRSQCEEKSKSDYLNSLLERSATIQQILYHARNEAALNETFAFSFLSESVNEEAFFIGNSLVIRAADHAFYPKKAIGPIFTNRGCSGIDGHIATAAGICIGIERPLIALIGDQTFLHDVNSLALMKALPITLIVINNQGGRIFEHLPIAEDKAFCETYLVNPSTHPIEHAAHLFNIAYTKVSAMDACLKLLGSPIASPRMIELCIEPKASLESFNHLINSIEKVKQSRLATALSCYFV